MQWKLTHKHNHECIENKGGKTFIHPKNHSKNDQFTNLKKLFKRLKKTPRKLKKTPISNLAFPPYLCNVDKEQKFPRNKQKNNNKFSNKQY